MMKDMRAMGARIALSASLALAGGCAAGTAGVTPNVWESGRTIEYATTSGQTMTMEIPGMGAMTTGISQTVELTLAAASAPREFQMKVRTVEVRMDVPDPSMDTGEMDQYKALEGLEATFTVAEDGLVATASGLDENRGVQAMGGVEGFKEQMLQSFFLPLPESGEISQGVRWTRESRIPVVQSGMEMEISSATEYLVEEQTEYGGFPVWKIAVNSEDQMAGGGDQMGMPMDMAAAGRTEGTLYVELGTNALVYAESTAFLSGDITAPGMSIDIDINVTSSVERR
ncbi:MAG: hypothetical protein R6W82_09280 [bacterium]